MNTTTIYEVREQSNETPEASRMLRVFTSFSAAMACAERYNERNVNASVHRVENTVSTTCCGGSGCRDCYGK